MVMTGRRDGRHVWHSKLLVGLKARLTWNAVRSDVQRRFGLPIATGLMLWVGIWLAKTHYATATRLGEVNPAAVPEYLAWTSLFLFLVWVALPVIIFPLDENLDPQQLAHLPLTGNQLTLGLAMSSFVAPSTVVPLLVIGSNAAIMPGAWWMVVPASLVYLGLLAVGSQLFSAAVSAILRTRRGRDIATFLVLGLAAGSFLIYRTVSQTIRDIGLEQAALSHSITDWSLLIPPVAAQQAMIEAVNGRPLVALAALVAAGVGLLALAVAWRSLLGWMMTTPEQQSRPARRARRTGMTGGPWGVIPTLARKELRFYVRDPRQRLVWTGTVIFVGLAIAGVVMNATGFLDIRQQPWAPIVAPVLVLFVGLPIALNLFGWERNAASYLFVLPIKAHHLLIGKNLAVATALAIETVVLTIGLAWFSGQWGWVWLAMPLMVAAIGCQMAVGNMISVLTPLRLPREGTDVFAQSTEQGCLAIVSQAVSFFAIGFLLVPPASVVVLTVDFGQVIPPWFAALFSIIWGLALYGVSLFFSGRLLRRRLPEVLAWVQVV
jgi:ABC-2 type transport system permease protein